jgi:hypothetical protein
LRQNPNWQKKQAGGIETELNRDGDAPDCLDLKRRKHVLPKAAKAAPVSRIPQ